MPINIAQATLGSKVSVKTLDGTKVAIRIPPGTASGKRFRVRSQGIEKDGTKGDLIVEVEVGGAGEADAGAGGGDEGVRRGGGVEVLARPCAGVAGLVAREGVARYPGVT